MGEELLEARQLGNPARIPRLSGQLFIQLSPHSISRTALKGSRKASDTLAGAVGDSK